jgi:microcin C transport system substrate-binding protein
VLRPEALWHDGKPVTADDVIFTIEILKLKGSPTLKTLLLPITGAEKRGPRTVRIHMSGQATRQLPLQISSGMRIVPRHYWAKREFERTTLEPPLGSGPYRIAGVDPGRSVTYERVRDYWAKDLNVNVGHFNYDRIQYKYYHDFSIHVEAVKGRDVDVNVEYVPKVWVTGYETPAKLRGHFLQERIETKEPGLNRVRIINLRRKKFQDPRVREALTLAYDHQWTDATLTYHGFPLTRSFFENSDLAHHGPPSAEELALLEPFREELDPRVFEKQWDPPVTSGHGRSREHLVTADRLLKEAGWIVRDGVRVNERTGEPFQIEFLIVVPELTATTLSYADSLKKLGIDMTIRAPYTAEYRNLIHVKRDFDMTISTFALSIVPGVELWNLFGSRTADLQYSRNWGGIKSPVVDFLIEKIVGANSRAELRTAAHALDRVLCWSFFYTNIGTRPGTHYAHWNIFGRPALQPRFATGFPSTWWIDPVKEGMVASGQTIEVDRAAVR